MRQSSQPGINQFRDIAYDAVLTYGLRIFPLNPLNKRPLIKNGVLDASDDPMQAAQWANKFPYAMVGIAAGRLSNYWVFDIDVKTLPSGEIIDGYASLAELEKRWGPLPQSMRVRTPGGGTHIYFKLPAGVKLSNRSGDIAPGLDVRSEGGYTVYPGCYRSDGGKYELQSPKGFDGIESAPDWLLFHAVFGKRRRESLVHMGIRHPSDFDDMTLPPDKWDVEARKILQPRKIDGPAEELTDKRATAIHRYVLSSIKTELTTIENAVEGTRDSTINTSTLLIWSLIKGAQQQGLETAALESEVYSLLCEACAGLGEEFADDDYVRDKWERKGEVADPRDLSNIAVGASRELADIAGMLGDGALEDWDTQPSAGTGDSSEDKPEQAKREWPCLKKVGKEWVPDPAQLKNVLALLEWSKVEVSHDVFRDLYFVKGMRGYDQLCDNALNRLWAVARSSGLPTTFDTFARLLNVASDNNRFHPVLDYLSGLKWDGVARVDRWLVDYVGAEDTPLNQEFGRLMLIGGIRRVLEPGCKFDHCLVIEGPQNAGKSTVAAILGGAWYSDNLRLGVDPKLTIEAIRGRWVVEIPELSGMMSREVEAVKAQITTQVDRARPAYGRQVVESPRQCIFIGTTNDDRYLRDRTGNRRFLPVRCGAIDLVGLRRDRDQLWAEALHRVSVDAETAIMREAVRTAAAEAQADRVVVDPFEEALNEMVEQAGEMLEGKSGYIAKNDLWRALGRKEAGNRSQKEQNIMADAMKKLGWTLTRVRRKGTRVYAFSKMDKPGAVNWLMWANDMFIEDAENTAITDPNF
jgi:hypothetical protein